MSAPAFDHEASDRFTLAWDELALRRPKLASTARRYLVQQAISMRPSTTEKTNEVLLGFCRYLSDTYPRLTSFSKVRREHIESYKAHLAARQTAWGTPLKANTVRLHLSMVRTFFDRMLAWGYPDAPPSVPIFRGDLPKVPEPLPRALDDSQAARLLAAAASDPDPCRQLCVELLARTGMRVGELCALEADAVSCRSGSWWLRIPLGKLYNDRYVPLHPRLVELLSLWREHHNGGSSGLLITRGGRALDRYAVARMINQVARVAGLGHVHPHQLRHTLATQAINRGMRLEAVAELLGHRNLRMTLAYARIANRTVAEQFGAVQSKVDALYAESEELEETAGMRALRLEHRRLLGNGWCTRPRDLDCHFESICEGCGFFETTVEFLPILRAQRDHAAAHEQPSREDLYDRLVARAEGVSR